VSPSTQKGGGKKRRLCLLQQPAEGCEKKKKALFQSRLALCAPFRKKRGKKGVSVSLSMGLGGRKEGTLCRLPSFQRSCAKRERRNLGYSSTSPYIPSAEFIGAKEKGGKKKNVGGRPVDSWTGDQKGKPVGTFSATSGYLE